jgi:squalene synthase HpnC
MTAPAARRGLDPSDARERNAYAWCRRYTLAHEENFTVVSWLLPKPLRPHFYAVYAFCRWTDDLGDEAAGDRLALLDAWEAELRACYEGKRSRPLFIALGRTVETCAIPQELFLRLIEANRIDQRKQRFRDIDELLWYCEHSATPVGRMVLHVLGYHDERRMRLADATCIGLQLANFWQDVSVDLRKGRIYLPQADMRLFGYDEAALQVGVVNAAFRELMRFEVERARGYFRRGKRLEALVDRRARVDISLFRLGGEAVLDAIEQFHYDVLTSRPRASRTTKVRLALEACARLTLGL